MNKRGIFAVLLSAIMLVSFATPTVYAATARITIDRIDGRNADLYRNNTTNATRPRANNRINTGDTLITGADTDIYLNIGDSSLLKMDNNSTASFALANDLVAVTLQEGNIFVQATDLAVEVQIGDVAISAQDAIFTIGHFAENTLYIAMLAGSGEIGGVVSFNAERLDAPFGTLREGRILTVWQNSHEPEISGEFVDGVFMIEIERNLTISEIFLEELDQFTLQEISTNSQHLLTNSGFITEETLQQISPLLGESSVAATSANSRSMLEARERWQSARRNRLIEERELQNNQNNYVDTSEPQTPEPMGTAPPSIPEEPEEPEEPYEPEEPDYPELGGGDDDDFPVWGGDSGDDGDFPVWGGDNSNGDDDFPVWGGNDGNGDDFPVWGG